MEKDYAVSSIRMIATFMVVVLHILQQFERISSHLHILTDWCNLGLVMFFCISGYLYSSRTINEGWIWHRYKEIVIPSIITVIATLVVYSLCFEIPDKKIIVYSLVSGLGFEALVPNGWMFIQLWFLTYILFCYLSVPFIQKIKVRDMSEIQFWGMLVASTAVFQGGAMLINRVIDIPTLSWGVLLRFYLPYFLYRRYGGNNRQKKVYEWMVLVSIILFIITCFARYVVHFDGVAGAIAELLFIYTQTIIGTVIFHFLRNFFQEHRISEKLLKLSDKYSYSVYLTHCFFIGYSTSIIFKCRSVVVGTVMAILLTVIASVFVTNITTQIKKVMKS